MDAYKVKSIVRNGQILINLPTNFDNTVVEVIVLQIIQVDVSDRPSKDLSKNFDKQVDEKIEEHPTNGVAITEPKLKLGGRMSKETAADLHLQLKNMRDEWD